MSHDDESFAACNKYRTGLSSSVPGRLGWSGGWLTGGLSVTQGATLGEQKF